MKLYSRSIPPALPIIACAAMHAVAGNAHRTRHIVSRYVWTHHGAGRHAAATRQCVKEPPAGASARGNASPAGTPVIHIEGVAGVHPFSMVNPPMPQPGSARPANETGRRPMHIETNDPVIVIEMSTGDIPEDVQETQKTDTAPDRPRLE